jgi:hypothetical protein
MEAAMVDPQSGELATQWCPSRVRQWYKPGRAPQETCHLHTGPPQGQIAVDAGDHQQSRDPISAAARGIGNILKKIFHW